MKNLILSMNVSLDGFVAGLKGEMDWIHADEQLFNYIVKLTDQADTAMYGRVTYEMMNAYWPTAQDQPNPSTHDINHSIWYNQVNKIVISNKMKDVHLDKTQFIGEDIIHQVQQLKQQPGKNILMFGSPSAAHTLMQYNLIDDYWLFINPVLLGNGIPLFDMIKDKMNLKLIESQVFTSGVIEVHYEKQP